MTTFTDVFERKEVKYRLNACQHQAMLDALEGRMAPDEFGRTRIVSLYLDTPERMLIERSLDKPLYKEKLRLRGYGTPQEDDRVFVEIKKKYEGIVYKRRVGCSLAAARAYLGGLPYEQACSRYPLADSVMAEESLAPRSIQIAREIDSLVARYGTLRPSMMIVCERVAYAPAAELERHALAGGLDAAAFASAPAIAAASQASMPANAAASPGVAALDQSAFDDVRITFDESIAYRDLFSPATTSLRPLLQAGSAVMEIKVAGPFPLWLVQALNACKAYPSSFSKYGEAYRACAATAAAAVPVAAPVRQPSTRAAHAEVEAECLAAALRDDRPHRFRAPTARRSSLEERRHAMTGG